MIDLLVVGGGPAGLATGIHAVRAGLSVLVVEPRDTPIDKACGEGLMPGAVRSLAELDVRPDGTPFRGIRYRAGSVTAEGFFRSGLGRGVRRTTLHEALARRADAEGVPRDTGRIVAVRQDTEGVVAGGIRARWLVAADGLHSPIRRSLGLELPARGRARYGLRRHFDIAPWGDLVEVHWARHAEAYVTPVGPSTVGVALLMPGGRGYGGSLRSFPELGDRLGDVAAVSDVRGAGPLRQRVRRRVAGRVLLVGDAAGYVDALTGEGINLALRAAQVAVKCLAAGTPEAYEGEWRRLSRTYRAMTHGLLWVSGQAQLRQALVPAAQRLPRVFEAAVNRLA